MHKFRMEFDENFSIGSSSNQLNNFYELIFLPSELG